nr:PREDICTED: uncharacterized protein LOC104959626 [Notothenia coriiceps]
MLSYFVLLSLQNAGDVESTLNILNVLDELLSAGTDRRIHYMISKGGSEALLSALVTTARSFSPNYTLLVPLLHLLAKVGQRDRRIGMKADEAGAVLLTLNLLRKNDQHANRAAACLWVIQVFCSSAPLSFVSGLHRPPCTVYRVLGSDHAAANLAPTAVCSACRLIPRSSRHQRSALFEGCCVSPVEDPELDVMEIEELEQGVLCAFAISTPDGSEQAGEPPASGLLRPVQHSRPSFHPPLPDVQWCSEATWWQPLRMKAPVATWAGIHSDTECPGVPPLEESLAAHLLPTAGWAEERRPLPPLSRDRERLVHMDKIFKYFAALPLRLLLRPLLWPRSGPRCATAKGYREGSFVLQDWTDGGRKRPGGER